MALTATATDRVRHDCQAMLDICGCAVFQGSVNRGNLAYKVVAKADAAKDVLADIVRRIRESFSGKTGIIYCLSRKDAEDVAQGLGDAGLRALPYHSDLSEEYRMRVQEQWSKGVVHIIVATIAFGMGINKAEVRYPIHHSMSKSIAAYYQESGRGGRDGLRAECILYYRPGDLTRLSTLTVHERNALAGVYEMAKYCEARTCRRAMLSECFGERRHLCSEDQAFCDTCLAVRAADGRGGGARKRGASEEDYAGVDMTEYAQVVLKIVEPGGAGARPKSLTLNKIVEQWKKAAHVPGINSFMECVM
jgi:RecQ family ATP-dependent DNA helicase